MTDIAPAEALPSIALDEPVVVEEVSVGVRPDRPRPERQRLEVRRPDIVVVPPPPTDSEDLGQLAVAIGRLAEALIGVSGIGKDTQLDLEAIAGQAATIALRHERVRA